MSDCPEAASAAPQPDERAGRLAKFEREQLIVDYLNRGVSIAEIATRFDVGEKRMRAIVREIIARRQPHPPEEFVAIQVSRLNEALLVAFSAMSVTNLKAVDSVVKIVRELDRYHGLVAAGRRRPGPEPLDPPAEAIAAYGPALICSARFATEATAGNDLEQRAPLPLSPLQRGSSWGERLRRPVSGAACSAPHSGLLLADEEKDRPGSGEGGDRPRNPPQDIKTIDSAPGIPARPEGVGRDAALPEARDPERRQRPLDGDGSPLDRRRPTPTHSGGDGGARPSGGPAAAAVMAERVKRAARFGGYDEAWPLARREPQRRPENPPQGPEKAESAPVIASLSPAARAGLRDTVPASASASALALALGLPKDAPTLSGAAAGSPRPSRARDDALDDAPAAQIQCNRPKNLPQGPEKLESPPGFARLADSLAEPDRPLPANPAGPTGLRRVNCRMTPNGVMSC